MASVLASSSTRLPVIVVLGATGTGKSKLALEIAMRFKGEIISADSMQVYRGLDIVTNKVTPEEASLVPHHLLDFLDPLTRFTVTDFRNAALPVLERLHKEEKIPVIVGGTNYYIESLLWKVLIDGAQQEREGKLAYERDSEVYGNVEKKRDASDSDRFSPKRSKVCGGGGEEEEEKETVSDHEKGESENGEAVSEKNEKNGKIDPIIGGSGRGLPVYQDVDLPTDQLYKRLQEVDKDIAASYHPNERRKIIRSLQVWQQTGRPHSHLLKEQRQQEGGSGYGGALRYPNSVILWITCEQDVLLERLDARVDEMIERGLLKELLDFHASYNSCRIKEEEPAAGGGGGGGGGTADYTKGIFQSIGFKEFHEFLILPKKEREEEKGRRLYEAGVAAMKLATRQYTKKQLRWIKNRFLTPSDRKVPPLYILDATDPTLWEAKVWHPAEAVVEALVEGRVPDLMPANPPPPHPQDANTTRNTKSRHECEVCQRVFIGEHIWRDHLRGAKHRKMVRRKAMQQGKAEETTATATTTAATITAATTTAASDT